ncbi:MAG: hypothetical protein GY810_14850 [Aureispira sp.]|nr:hypothetical protein [Aureispira sp.]
MKVFVGILALWIIGLTSALGQTLNMYEKAGDEAFAKKDYYNAVYYYDQVLKSRKTSGVYFKYAEASRMSYAYKKAEEAYQKVVEGKDKSKYSLLDFHYATTLKHNAKYEEAAVVFERFLKNYRKDNFYKAKAIQEYKSCTVARKLVKNPIDTIEIKRLGDHINTEYSDFGAHEIGDNLYYSSLRFERERPKDEKKEKEKSKRLIAKLLLTPKESKKKGKQIKALNVPSLHNANSTLSPDGKRLYFTRCNGKSEDSIRCELFVATLQSDSTWGGVERLPNPINSNRYTTTHPYSCYDPIEKQEQLFFVSDRAGGKGKNDIWYVSMKEGLAVSEPTNLGEVINTRDEEATPFFHAGTQTLYFSSRWHYGLGGYDIFKTKKIDGQWSKPENLGVPMNSASNDFYYIINEDDSTGYFASNRAGSRTLTEESCCNDIYKYAMESALDVPEIDTTTEPTIDTNTIVSVDPPNTDPDPDPTKDPDPDTPPNGDGGNTTETTTDITQKIEELNEMLPLSLYFHNDEPDSNTTKATTNKPYELPYQHYIGLKDLYKANHASQFDVEQRPLMLKKVDDFFENEVRGEYNRMNDFYEAVLALLDAGVKLEIQIKGYTSPRSNEGYNVALAKRRIMSVRKQLFIYKKGAFLPHFQQGHFSVKEVPLGESTSPDGVNDQMDDPKNSIFGVEASKERRAEIIVLQKQ